MSILNIAIETPNLTPRLIRVQTNDTLSEIISANYLEGAIKQGFTFYESDLFEISDSSNVSRFFRPTITSTAITLTQTAGTVNGAVVSGNLAVFDGTSGDLEDAGARLIAGTTAVYAGGGTSNAFTVAGLTVAAKGTAVIRASTNSVSITKALPGTNTLTITFSADPGADTTVDYIYSTAALT